MCQCFNDGGLGPTSNYIQVTEAWGCPDCCGSGLDQHSSTSCQCLRCGGSGVVYEPPPQPPMTLSTASTDGEEGRIVYMEPVSTGGRDVGGRPRFISLDGKARRFPPEVEAALKEEMSRMVLKATPAEGESKEV